MQSSDFVKVIHLRNAPSASQNGTNGDVYVYIGRNGAKNKPNPNMIYGNWGNPFRVAEYGHGVCIDMFRNYLRENYIKDKRKLQEDPQYRPVVLDRLHWLYDLYIQTKAKGKTLYLVCFCAPKPCHGDVLKETLLKMEDYYQQHPEKI